MQRLVGPVAPPVDQGEGVEMSLRAFKLPVCGRCGLGSRPSGEIHTIQVLPAPKGVNFPHVKQVFLIERHVHDLDEGLSSSVAVLSVTSLTTTQTGPDRLASFARSE